MPSLNTLPKELQLQIAEYVREQKGATSNATATNRDQLGLKADLKNLCLVCKEMRDVGTPLLYKDMVVNVDKMNSDFQQVIKTTKDHSGLPHVRTLRVTRDDMRDPPPFARYRAVSQLLSAMPRDTLTHFQ